VETGIIEAKIPTPSKSQLKPVYVKP